MGLNPHFKADLRQAWDIEGLQVGIEAGDRLQLARGITLVESQLADDRPLALDLLSRLCPKDTSRRIAVTGNPGSGKSTLIESMGQYWVDRGKSVAVLAIDPSSKVTGGSILGDKTRMEQLAHHPKAFIRPSASGGLLGGVARRSRECIALCEAAGYDIILIETVGVGQNETAVEHFVDCFLMVALPSAGDELQGIKRGIMEKADLIVVNKADGNLMKAAKQSQLQIKNALHMMQNTSAWQPVALTCSAIQGEGIDALMEELAACLDLRMEPSNMTSRRLAQTLEAFESAWKQLWLQRATSHPLWAESLATCKEALMQGEWSLDQALARLRQVK
ncbi:MAG: methylmalonyl Co-A mutase-associated GTPase MeaB [Flavobacteriales bacterium]|jgi:LAO/AO transport system kinase|nr:methylmalonyl Co-A mutase-associated GTPase MeaB [Flavobacteriales bacterium]MBT5341869.1 methylmalonyl Co-A mutase-associated GTPase MeaB [Flavobacteriales bacterium]MBT5422142.1 methylmalonyl Co-A mutase-associated GTPase MeaB [Flavobacteriales bacterium]